MPQSPRQQLNLQSLAADHPFQGSDVGLIFLNQSGGSHVVIRGARLAHADPDPDQLPGDGVALGKRMRRLPGKGPLSDLSLERRAVGSVLRHRFHPPEAQHGPPNPTIQSVHAEGRTPPEGEIPRRSTPRWRRQRPVMQRAGTLRYVGPPRPGVLHHRPAWDNSSKQEPVFQVNRNPKKQGRSAGLCVLKLGDPSDPPCGLWDPLTKGPDKTDPAL